MSRCCSYINSSFRRGPACGVERTEVRSKVPGHSRSDGRGRRTGGLEGTWLTEGTREELALFSPHNTRKRTPWGGMQAAEKWAQESSSCSRKLGITPSLPGPARRCKCDGQKLLTLRPGLGPSSLEYASGVFSQPAAGGS